MGYRMNYLQEIQQIENKVFKEDIDLEESSMAIQIGFAQILTLAKKMQEENVKMFELLKELYDEFSFDMNGDMDCKITDLFRKIEGESPHDPKI